MYTTEILSLKTDLTQLKPFHNGEQFLAMCRECKNYNTLWSCPPYSFEPLQLLSEFAQVELFATKIIFSANARLSHNTAESAATLAKTVMDTEKRNSDALVFKMEKNVGGSLALYSGGCRLCEKCARPQGRPCAKPETMRYSLESLGYDVGGITKNLFNVPLLWFKNQLPEYMMLVTALLYK